MIPPLIVSQALALGIQLIAITDHNASANVKSVMEAAAQTGLTVLAGIELQTREEVHSLCIFDTLEQLQTFQDLVDSTLPALKNQPDFFGPQYVVDATGEFIREENRLLLTSSSLSLDEACARVLALDGLFIPAHVNRKANGLLELLGLVPPGFEALEISRHITPAEAVKAHPQLHGYTLVQSGDVHFLDGFLGTTQICVEDPCLAEIRSAINAEDGRTLSIICR